MCYVHITKTRFPSKPGLIESFAIMQTTMPPPPSRLHARLTTTCCPKATHMFPIMSSHVKNGRRVADVWFPAMCLYLNICVSFYLYLSLYIYIYICIYVYIYIYTQHIYIYIDIHLSLSLSLSIYIYIYISISLSLCLRSGWQSALQAEGLFQSPLPQNATSELDAARFDKTFFIFSL